MHRYVKSTNKPTISNKNKDDAVIKMVEFVSKDLRPLEIVNGSGFKQLQFVVDLAAQKGQFNVHELLTTSTTISRNLNSLAEIKRNDLKAKIKTVINNIGCALTIDFWSDAHKKIDILFIIMLLPFILYLTIITRIFVIYK
jgi:hypothetical protein